jgi:hypothetical protein
MQVDICYNVHYNNAGNIATRSYKHNGLRILYNRTVAKPRQRLEEAIPTQRNCRRQYSLYRSRWGDIRHSSQRRLVVERSRAPRERDPEPNFQFYDSISMFPIALLNWIFIHFDLLISLFRVTLRWNWAVSFNIRSFREYSFFLSFFIGFHFVFLTFLIFQCNWRWNWAVSIDLCLNWNISLVFSTSFVFLWFLVLLECTVLLGNTLQPTIDALLVSAATDNRCFLSNQQYMNCWYPRQQITDT